MTEMISTTETTRTVAETYFDAWRTRDFDRLRSVLAPDVSFVGVMGVADGADACLAGLRGMAESIMDDLVLHARVADGDDVITWFDLVTKDGATLPTANWSHVEDGLITRIRVTFDPRPLGNG
ncbi:nuclear transport factor 2 family protein [Gordonia polyisoprenivorans]|uniref:Nuclear transport factor 2 family protein n=1 Tax=Gordonia polyisoprenivorans TaxID=84595 RepID=A0A846WHS0_9ACTN|nr:nuclear transport factor 2 family protein [Gordonia polyisoprenivorans]MBE7194492.1 nuclear transport factor 2 family protein [Gordonia polyisoprenivorans]NKY01292.1 nuclear transport factor 2 family protein [Gordonia polyisoprenivorans]QUD81311.1 nuclear transport factor 2 family protein [Gordonia polyisoprenivorans]UZF58054.1 nuclear transport factor 2 family protein [Gordonia polyisoprenivorans]WCB39094.1 nuclear transport factor 2 family protein [Gordonia polyisoprenivorans]